MYQEVLLEMVCDPALRSEPASSAAVLAHLASPITRHFVLQYWHAIALAELAGPVEWHIAHPMPSSKAYRYG